MPLVSIITPFHNSDRYLSSTVEAILTQSFPDWELILIDDCSSDDSAHIARWYYQKDHRIRVARMDEPGGPAKARNLGISMATGRYIAFCDSDDVWLPEKLQKQLDAMTGTGEAVCFTSYFKMLQDGERTGRMVMAEPRVTYEMLLVSNYIGCSTAMYDTQRCGRVFMPDIIKRQDYGLWLRIMSRGFVAVGISEPLVYYRVRTDSVSSNKLLAMLYHWRVLRSVTGVGLLHASRLFLQYLFLGFSKHLK